MEILGLPSRHTGAKALEVGPNHQWVLCLAEVWESLCLRLRFSTCFSHFKVKIHQSLKSSALARFCLLRCMHIFFIGIATDSSCGYQSLPETPCEASVMIVQLLGAAPKSKEKPYVVPNPVFTSQIPPPPVPEISLCVLVVTEDKFLLS